MSRISKDEWHLQMAELTSQRSTCARRSVGCVLVNERGHVLATGYNGVARGLPHCNAEEAFLEGPGKPARMVQPNRCAGAGLPSGTGLDQCEAVHAEQNALLQCGDVEAVRTAYVTVSPCVTCVKLLLNTGCQRIVFREPYAHDAAARNLWERAGRGWTQLPRTG